MRQELQFVAKSLLSHKRTLLYYVGGNRDSSDYILFINGMYSDKNDWIKQKRKFEKNYRLLFFEYVNADIEEGVPLAEFLFGIIADDIKAIINNEGATKITIIAHSMGGPIGLYFTTLYPELVEKIVLINSGVEVGLHFKIIVTNNLMAPQNLMPLQKNTIVSSLYPFSMAWWYSADYLEHITKTEEGYVTFSRMAPPLNNDQLEVFFKLLRCVFEIPQAIPRLESVSNPVLLITASSDFVFPVKKQKEHLKVLKNLQIEIIEEFTHNVHIEHYDLINNMIMSFMQE